MGEGENALMVGKYYPFLQNHSDHRLTEFKMVGSKKKKKKEDFFPCTA